MKVKIKRRTSVHNVIRRKKFLIAFRNAIIVFLGIIACCGIAADAGICLKIFSSENPMGTLKDNMILIGFIAILTSISGNIVLAHMEGD
jgi:hypothetical protein